VVDELGGDPEVPPAFGGAQLTGERQDDDLERAAGGDRRAGGLQVIQEQVAERLRCPLAWLMSWTVTLSTPCSSMRTAAASSSACFPSWRVMVLPLTPLT